MGSAQKEPGPLEWTICDNFCGPVIALNYLQRPVLRKFCFNSSARVFLLIWVPFSLQMVPFSGHTVNYILYGTELVAPNLSDAEKTLFVFITSISIKLFHRAFVADRWCPHYPGNLVVVFIAFISSKKHVWPRKIDILDLHIFGTILHVFARPRMGLTNRVLAQEHFATTFCMENGTKEVIRCPFIETFK